MHKHNSWIYTNIDYIYAKEIVILQFLLIFAVFGEFCRYSAVVVILFKKQMTDMYIINHQNKLKLNSSTTQTKKKLEDTKGVIRGRKSKIPKV